MSWEQRKQAGIQRQCRKQGKRRRHVRARLGWRPAAQAAKSDEIPICRHRGLYAQLGFHIVLAVGTEPIYAQ